MGDLQEIFEYCVSEIRTLLLLAQTAGRVENYQLEVIFSSKSFLSQRNPHDGNLVEPLLRIMKAVQKMIAELSHLDRSIAHERELESFERTSSGLLKRNCNKENASRTLVQEPPLNTSSENSDRLQYLPLLDPVDHSHVERSSCLSPQHPTTKETEAANVLMNLSGKAADRSGHSRIEPFVSSKVLSSFDGKSTVFLLPEVSTSCKFEYDNKREAIACDEVPQINEKDLLPLATQVLCQFCSRQCEDLVELHEHVLAQHNVPDSDLPLMPDTKKEKHIDKDRVSVHPVPCSDLPLIHVTRKQKHVKEDTTSLYRVSSSEVHRETIGHKVKGNLSPSLSAEETGSNNKQMNKKRQSNGKTIVKSVKSRSNSQGFNSGNTHKHLGSLLPVGENKGVGDMTPKAVQTIQVPPREEIQRNLGLESLIPQGQHISASENKYKKPLFNECKPKENICSGAIERTPAASDPLAIAVESSKISLNEAKVTIFVCLKCSWCFTHSHEYKNHICNANQPLVTTLSDGSVVLVDSPSIYGDDLQFSNGNVWYFPEFVLRQRPDDVKQDVHHLEIIQCTSGRKLHLYTSYKPSYLGEHVISFRCTTCERDCDSFNRFLEHLTTGPCMFRCPECKLVYKTLDKLQTHRTAMHPSVEDRTCPNCQMVFDKRHQRNKHLKTKCSKNLSCSICGNVLKNEYNLSVHMQSHKEREHVCKECGAKFHRRALLLRHMLRHSGTRPHTCTLCHAKFFTRQHLNTHLDRHNGTKRYTCSACNKAYYSQHDRDKHCLKIHGRGSGSQKISRLLDEEINVDDPVVE